MLFDGEVMTGAEQVCVELRRHGVTDVFGLMGDGNVQWIPLLERHGIKYHASRHEAGAVAMADAYSRATGRVGVCTVTHGPGLTHCLSCIIEAKKASSQVLLLAGDTPVRPTAYSCQDLDSPNVLRSVGCESIRVTLVGTLARDMTRAFARVSAEQVPMTVLLPTDVQREECVYGPVQVAAPGPLPPPDPEVVSEVADLLTAADRVLLLAGRGAVRADAGPALEELAELSDGLLGTTVLAKGLFSGSPRSIDIVGGFSTTVAKSLIRSSDLVLGFGASLSTWTTLAGSLFADNAKLVQVSDAAAAVGHYAPVDLAIIADARTTAHALIDELRSRGTARSGFVTPELTEEIRNGRTELKADASTPELIDPRAVMLTLDELLPAERTISIDGGWHQVLPVRLLTSTDPRGFVFLQSYQALGPGMAAAIGAAIGRPERVSAVVLGDGALSMSLGELETATRLGVPIVVVVINDGAYHAEVHGLNEINQPTDTAYHADVDFAAVITALGGRGATIRDQESLERELSDWLKTKATPLLLDCKVPCPLDYWADQEWLEDLWHEPRTRADLQTEAVG